MQISLQPVRLDAPDSDDDGVLVFRGDRLVAVASRLSDLHVGLSGRWFVEAAFGPRDFHVGATFASEEELCHWAESLGDCRPEPRAAPMARSRRP